MKIKDSNEIKRMKVASRLAAKVLEMIEDHITVGVTTKQLDVICHQYIVNELKAIPSTLNHHGFPGCICTSINHVICHGIPSDKKLKNGDIINIDVTVKKDGMIGDTSKMYLVGDRVASHAIRLINLTQQALYQGISVVKPGNTTGDIGYVIETFAHKHNLSVVEEFCGHGIGYQMWEEPQITHFGKKGKGTELKAGMTFTIEPMLNLGKRDIKQLNDGWTVITKDRSLSAQFEHTILVTETGCDILTLRNEETKIISQYLQ
ncbi:MAG: type I methionyl aminopeptidase [Gammaproteobacteria bacterium]|nr:MAG: type I methionyl aminopeptidase [Gammaproteobacteria bacterium]